MIEVIRRGFRKLLDYGTIGAHLHAPTAMNLDLNSFPLAQVANWQSGTIVGVFTSAADTLYAMPFVSPARGGLVHAIAATINNNSDGIRLGIYANVDNPRDLYPGELLFGSDEITIAAGDQMALCLLQLDPNRVYWAAMILEVGKTGTYDGANYAATHLLGMDETATTVMPRCLTKAQAYGALPDPYPAGAAFSTAMPLIKVKYIG